ncbi:MAG: hypothetical protein S4CHLAM37_16840 [Chlamydiia bacterium]|nr:hypothetical protein [Chlamydiia bacterium]
MLFVNCLSRPAVRYAPLDVLEPISIPEDAKYIGRSNDLVAYLLSGSVYLSNQSLECHRRYELGGCDFGYVSDDYRDRKFALYRNIVLFQSESEKKVTLWDFREDLQQQVDFPEDVQGPLVRLCMNSENLYCVFKDAEGKDSLYSFSFENGDWNPMDSSESCLIAAEGVYFAFARDQNVVIRTPFHESEFPSPFAGAVPTNLYMNEGKLVVCYGKDMYVFNPETPQDYSLVDTPNQVNSSETLFIKDAQLLVKERLAGYHTYQI